MLVPKDKLSLAQIGKGCAMLEKKIEVKFFGNTNWLSILDSAYLFLSLSLNRDSMLLHPLSV